MESTRELRIDKLCRTCLSESPKMLSLADPMGNTTLKIFEALSFVANISVNPSDNFPNQICIECGPILLQSESFKRRCIESETKLQLMVQDQNNAAESSVKTEFSTENCNFPCIEPYQCAICLLKFSNVHELHLHALKLHKLEVKNQIDAEKESAEDSKVQVEILNNGNECVKQELFDGNEFDADNSYPDDFDAEFGADTQELLNALEIPINVKKKRKSYFCKSCNMNFNTSHLYHDHKRRLHKKNRSIKKEKISSTAKRKSVSSDDEKPLKMIKIEQEAYFCEMCGINFKTSKSFKNHVRRRHEPAIMSHTALETKLTSNNKHIRPKRELQCSICSRRFAKKSTLALHIQRHTSSEEKRHVCSLCKREFLHRAHLDNHILSIHTTDNGLKCQYCMIGFPTQDSLDLHILSHNIPKKHQCPHCAKAFNMLSTLKDHLRTHTGEKPFLCPTCGKGFSQNTNLIEHLRRHQGIKPFKCEICDQRFVSKGELAAHNRKHSGAHPFVCADCGSGFTTSSSLVKHRRTHTGERPYACDLCSMTFAASGTLKNHRRTHTGEKPYKCSHCDKAFVQKNDLVSHTRCHTGERPYVCPACGQAFRQSSALKTHLKMHQHKEPQMKEPLLHQVRKELMLPGLMLTPVTNIDGLN